MYEHLQGWRINRKKKPQIVVYKASKGELWIYGILLLAVIPLLVYMAGKIAEFLSR